MFDSQYGLADVRFTELFRARCKWALSYISGVTWRHIHHIDVVCTCSSDKVFHAVGNWSCKLVWLYKCVCAMLFIPNVTQHSLYLWTPAAAVAYHTDLWSGVIWAHGIFWCFVSSGVTLCTSDTLAYLQSETLTYCLKWKLLNLCIL